MVRRQSPSSSRCMSSVNHSRRLFQKRIEGFDCQINGRALEGALRHSLGGSDGRDQTQGVFESAAVAAGRDRLAEENVLPPLRYWLSSRVKMVLLLFRYLAATSHSFFHVKWNFRLNWQDVVADQCSAHRFAQSFDHSLVSELKYDIGTKQHVPNRILCKAADLSRWPVREKGVCSVLRFELNSTVTSDGGAQKLGNDFWNYSESIANQSLQPNRPQIKCVLPQERASAKNSTSTLHGGAQKIGYDIWHDYESIATKVCSPIDRKWNAMFESHVVTSVDRTSFDFRFEDFLGNLSL